MIRKSKNTDKKRPWEITIMGLPPPMLILQVLSPILLTSKIIHQERTLFFFVQRVRFVVINPSPWKQIAPLDQPLPRNLMQLLLDLISSILSHVKCDNHKCQKKAPNDGMKVVSDYPRGSMMPCCSLICASHFSTCFDFLEHNTLCFGTYIILSSSKYVQNFKKV